MLSHGEIVLHDLEVLHADRELLISSYLGEQQCRSARGNRWVGSTDRRCLKAWPSSRSRIPRATRQTQPARDGSRPRHARREEALPRRCGLRDSDNFMAQLHGWFEEHRPPFGRRSCGGTTSTSPTRICERIQADGDAPSSASAPDRLRAGGPGHVVDGSRSTGPDRGRARARVRAPRAQQREDERHAERAAGHSCRHRSEHLAPGRGCASTWRASA